MPLSDVMAVEIGSFWAALGLERLRADAGFADNSRRMTNRDELIGEIEQVTTTMTTESILDARDFYWDAQHPTIGDVRQIGSPMRFSRTPARRGNAAPQLGNATDRVLAELDGSPAVEASE